MATFDDDQTLFVTEAELKSVNHPFWGTKEIRAPAAQQMISCISPIAT
jgi:hypothetical protein